MTATQPLLINAVEMARQRPDQFWDFSRRAALRVGDRAVVTMCCHPDARLVVKVERLDAGVYHGVALGGISEYDGVYEVMC